MDDITLTGAQVRAVHEALVALAGCEIPASTAATVARALLDVQIPAQVIEERRRGLVEELAQRDDAGELIVRDGQADFGPNLRLFGERWSELLAESFVVSLPVLDVGRLGDAPVRPALLAVLMEVGILE